MSTRRALGLVRSSLGYSALASGWLLFTHCSSSADTGEPNTQVPSFMGTPSAMNEAGGGADNASTAPGSQMPSEVESTEGVTGSGTPISMGATPANGSDGTPPNGSDGTPPNGAVDGAAEDAAGGSANDPTEVEPTPVPSNGGSGGSNGMPLPSNITVWIAGDSTVANGQTPCPRGWGGVIDSRFDDRVTVVNSAAGGRSVHTWLYNVQPEFDDATGECALARDQSGNPTLQPRWQAMLDGMKAGDFLFIQFGINDGDPTCDRHVGIPAFRAAYAMMADAARARGAQPIFVTPVSSIACNGNTPRGSRGGFVPATLEEGAALGVPVIDLHARSVELYASLAFCPVAGGDVSATTTGAVGEFFCDDHTHFSASGTQQIADLIVSGLRDGDIPLAAYLR